MSEISKEAVSEQAREAASDLIEGKYVEVFGENRTMRVPYSPSAIEEIIQRAIDASRPKWSAEKPTKVGWYWAMSMSGDRHIFFLHHADRQDHPDDLRFAGPLPAPQEAAP